MDAAKRVSKRALLRLRAALRRDEGSALTEFAFVFGIYVLVTLGTMQVAMWAFTTAAAQFAVWEGCRAGAAAYQPPPSDGRDGGSLGDSHWTSSEFAAQAEFAAVNRTEAILGWLPITAVFHNLTASVVEEDVLPGQEGRREIVTSVRVKPFIFMPLLKPMLDATDPDGFGFARACRLRLGRFYSF